MPVACCSRPGMRREKRAFRPPRMAEAMNTPEIAVIVSTFERPAHLRRVLREQQRTNELLEAMRPVRRVENSEIPSLRVDPRDK